MTRKRKKTLGEALSQSLSDREGDERDPWDAGDAPEAPGNTSPVPCALCGALNDTDFGDGPPDALEGDLLQCGRCGGLTPYPGARVPEGPWKVGEFEYHGWVWARVEYPNWYPDTAEDDLLGRGYQDGFPTPRPNESESEDYEPHFPLCSRCNRKAHKPSAPCPAKREKLAQNAKRQARDEIRRFGSSER